LPCGDTDVFDDGIFEVAGSARSASPPFAGSFWIVGVNGGENPITQFSNCATVP
jgi:hypothetical protein